MSTGAEIAAEKMQKVSDAILEVATQAGKEQSKVVGLGAGT
jgi:hypothetical protein